MHVLVDDATRVAYTELLPAADGVSAAGFLRRAVAWLGRWGVRVERVMTDNAFAYRSQVYQATLHRLGAGHVRTRPYRPRTNGEGGAIHPDVPAGVGVPAPVPDLGGSRGRLAQFHSSLQHRAAALRAAAAAALARLLELSEQRA